MKINNYITDGIVIKSKENFIVTGKADIGKISLFLNEEILEEFSVSGDFSVEFHARESGYKSYKIIAKDMAGSVTVSDIVFGEIYLCLGQSNMSMSVEKCDNNALMAVTNSYIRSLNVLSRFDDNGYLLPVTAPKSEIDKSNWNYKDSYTKDSSALGLEIATKMARELNCPIGIVNVAVGGSSIDKWIKDGWLYNEKISPLKGVKFSAILWYQGESSAQNLETAKKYEPMLDEVFTELDKIFSAKIFAYLIATQNYCDDFYAKDYINEIIEKVTKKHNGEVVAIYDILPEWRNDFSEDYHPIHPVKKAEIGRRMAKILLKSVYGVGDTYSSEVINFKCVNNTAVVNFSAKSLNAKGEVVGFSVAGKNGIYYSAKAEIKGSSVILSSKRVDKIAHIAYAFFLYNNIANLYNEVGAPCLPYRDEYLKKAKNYCDFGAIGLGKKVWENCFSIECGGAKLVDYFSCSKNVELVSGEVILAKEKYAFGYLQLNNLLGYENDWARFNFMAITFDKKANLSELQFTIQATRYRVPIYRTEENEYIFNLNNLQIENGALVKISKSLKKYMFDRRLVFSLTASDKLKILNIEYFN